jgi:hypothetical protein
MVDVHDCEYEQEGVGDLKARPSYINIIQREDFSDNVIHPPPAA